MAAPVDLGQGSVRSVLAKLAVPLMLSLFFQNLYSYVNTVFVSWLGEVPLAAVSLAVPLTYVALSVAKGIAMGGVVLMSHARGAGDKDKVIGVAASVLPLMLLVMSLFLPLMFPPVCRMFFLALGADISIVEQGSGFVFWLVAGFPVMGYVMAVESLFTAQGNTVTPMKAMLWGNVLNIILDPVYIFVFGWGTAGAGAAVLTCQLVSALYLRYQMIRNSDVQVKWLPTNGFGKMAASVAGQGSFVAMAYLVSPMALILLNSILVWFGPAAVGAWNIMSRTEMLVLLPVMGLSNALAAFVSFNLGRRDFSRIRQGLTFFFQASWGLAVPVTVLFLTVPGTWVVLFRPDEQMRVLAMTAMQASGISILFAPLIHAVSGLSQGLKKPVFMTGLIVVYLLVLRIPTAFWVASRWGEAELFWSHPAASAGAALLATALIWRLVTEAKECSA